MSNVRRVYVEKKPDFAVQAKDLKHEIKGYLGISDVESVRVLIRYDVENVSDETFEKACKGIFASRSMAASAHSAEMAQPRRLVKQGYGAAIIP